MKAETSKQSLSQAKIHKLVSKKYEKIMDENLEIYKKHLGKVSVENARLQEELKALQQKYEEDAKAAKSIPNLKKVRKEVLLEKIKLEDEFEAFRTNHDTTIKKMRESFQQEIEDLNKKHQNNVQKIKAKLEKEKEQAVNKTTNEYEEKISKLEKQLSKEIRTLTREKEVLGNKVETLTASCKDKDSKIVDLENKMREESEGFEEALNRQRREASSEINNLRHIERCLKEKLLSRNREAQYVLVRSFKDELLQVENLIKQKDEANETLRSGRRHIEACNDALEVKNEYLRVKVSKLEREIADTNQKSAQDAKEHEERLEIIANLEIKIEELTKTKDELNEKLESSKSKNAEYCQKYKDLKELHLSCLDDLKSCYKLPIKSKRFAHRFNLTAERYLEGHDRPTQEELQANFQKEIDALKAHHEYICSKHKKEVASLKYQLKDINLAYNDLRYKAVYAENQLLDEMARFKKKQGTYKGEVLWETLRSDIKNNKILPKIDCWRGKEEKTQPQPSGPDPDKLPYLNCAFKFDRPPELRNQRPTRYV